MAFLRPSRLEEDLEVIRGSRVLLRRPTPADYCQWAELRTLSRSHLKPWEPSWAPDDLSHAMFRRRLRVYARDVRDDLAYAYYIFENSSTTLLGGITLSNVRRGSAQMASVGYWMGAPYVGKGIMQEAVKTLLPVAFSALRLHRIEAASMPTNLASQRVLEACGFHREGFAKGYLKINGRWEDHILYARVAEPSPPIMARDAKG